MTRISDYARLVKFSHSIFALPFALMSAWLASGGLPEARVLGLVVLCMVAARTAAMGFNRLVDRRIDAANPRTASRELPAGVLSSGGVTALVVASSLVFLVAAWALNPLCGKLAPVVLLVLLGYSYTKRFTSLAHLVLGLSLGLAPLGAWLAVRGGLDGDLSPPLLLAAAVLFWVAGFDLIYACQDVEFDRKARLHSIPARFGVARALTVSRAFHLATACALILFHWRADLSWVFALAVVGALALLLWEHTLVKPNDLSRVDLAFFTVNGWIGIGLFGGLVLDLAALGGGGV